MGKKIYLTRGDTAYIDVALEDNSGNNYEPVQGDKLYFRLKKNVYEKALIVEKEIDLETLKLEITPEDTKMLGFGTYCYEVELVTEAGEHFTVIENAAFVVGADLR